MLSHTTTQIQATDGSVPQRLHLSYITSNIRTPVVAAPRSSFKPADGPDFSESDLARVRVIYNTFGRVPHPAQTV